MEVYIKLLEPVTCFFDLMKKRPFWTRCCPESCRGASILLYLSEFVI